MPRRKSLAEDLETIEEFSYAYQRIDTMKLHDVWARVDVFKYAYGKLGITGINELAKQCNLTRPKRDKYLRLALAYEVNERDSRFSPDVHWIASLSDKISARTGKFKSRFRFEFLKHCIRHRCYTVKEVGKLIVTLQEDGIILPDSPLATFGRRALVDQGEICSYCKKRRGTLVRFSFHSMTTPYIRDGFHFHIDCYKELIMGLEKTWSHLYGKKERSG